MLWCSCTKPKNYKGGSDSFTIIIDAIRKNCLYKLVYYICWLFYDYKLTEICLSINDWKNQFENDENKIEDKILSTIKFIIDKCHNQK